MKHTKCDCYKIYYIAKGRIQNVDTKIVSIFRIILDMLSKYKQLVYIK